MQCASISGVSLETRLDVGSTWRRKAILKTVPIYVLMRPGEQDVQLSDEDLARIDPRLPLILYESIRNSRSNPSEAGLIVRSNLQMSDRLAPPGLPASCLSDPMHYLCEIKEVQSIGPSEVFFVGHCLHVCDGRHTERMAVGVQYWASVGIPVSTLEDLYPGIRVRLSILSGMGLSPA
jgi:hypothetical protein